MAITKCSIVEAPDQLGARLLPRHAMVRATHPYAVAMEAAMFAPNSRTDRTSPVPGTAGPRGYGLLERPANVMLRHHAGGTPLPPGEQWPGKDRCGELVSIVI